jgi:chromosome segregation ATPase
MSQSSLYRSGFRRLLRAATFAFQGDDRTLKQARIQLRSEFKKNKHIHDSETLAVLSKDNSLTTAIQALGHHRSKIVHWKLKHPESMEEFDTAALNIHQIEQFLTKLDGDHTGLLLEVKVLQNSLTDLKNKYSNLEDLLVRETAKREQLEQEFQELKTTSAADKLAAQHESDKQKSIIRAFDLIRMYRHYYAESVVGGNWGNFCEKFYEFEQDVFQKKKNSNRI